MNLLLWKEYRQNRNMLLALAIFLCLPYIIAILIGMVARMKSPPEYGPPLEPVVWGSIIGIASGFSLSLLVVGCAFIAGNIVAGERTDRSAEFVAYLPISRRRAISAKALFCGIAIVTAALVQFTAGLLSIKLAPALSLEYVTEGVGVGSTVAILVFGMAWLTSTLVNTPAIAAASGIGSAGLLFMTLGLLDFARGYGDTAPALKNWFVPLSLLIGTCSFVAGVVHYLRRVEP